MNKLIFIIIVMFVFINSVCASTEKFAVKFSDCVDGDTFKVLIDEEEYVIRMLAIDTPETVKPGTEVEDFGKEASDYTCDKITNAKKIELEYDDNSDKKDKYDRILAWIYIDDSLLQEDLISLGYAKVAYIYGEYKYTDELYTLEEVAKKNKVGLWENIEEVSSETNDSEDNTFWNEIQDLINKYIEKWIKSIINDFGDYINKLIKEVFN